MRHLTSYLTAALAAACSQAAPAGALVFSVMNDSSTSWTLENLAKDHPAAHPRINLVHPEQPDAVAPDQGWTLEPGATAVFTAVSEDPRAQVRLSLKAAPGSPAALPPCKVLELPLPYPTLAAAGVAPGSPHPGNRFRIRDGVGLVPASPGLPESPGPARSLPASAAEPKEMLPPAARKRKDPPAPVPGILTLLNRSEQAWTLVVESPVAPPPAWLGSGTSGRTVSHGKARKAANQEGNVQHFRYGIPPGTLLKLPLEEEGKAGFVFTSARLMDGAGKNPYGARIIMAELVSGARTLLVSYRQRRAGSGSPAHPERLDDTTFRLNHAYWSQTEDAPDAATTSSWPAPPPSEADSLASPPDASPDPALPPGPAPLPPAPADDPWISGVLTE